MRTNNEIIYYFSDKPYVGKIERPQNVTKNAKFYKQTYLTITEETLLQILSETATNIDFQKFWIGCERIMLTKY